MKIRIFKILVMVLLVFSCGIINGQNNFDFAINKDIVYGHIEGVDLLMDIGLHEGDGPFPAILKNAITNLFLAHLQM